MIREAQGDFLHSGCDALVNPVNCDGVMKKGLALQFARAWPGMLPGYQRDCHRTDVTKKLRPGRLNIYLTPVASPAYIINFPTKDHWRNPSKLDYIRWGLTALRDVIPELNIQSIAVPALGCGLGGLPWPPVRELIATALGDLDDLDVALYPPQ